MSEKKTFNILSIDGGGIRGIIPAMVLAEIERRVACVKDRDKGFVPTSELFDLVVGTSTGGILALGLTQNGTCEKPPLSAEELVEIYEKYGSTIFNLSLAEDTLSKGKEILESIGDPESITKALFSKLAGELSDLGRDALSVLERLTDEKYSREGLGDVLNCFIDETLCLKDVNTKTMVTCYDIQAPQTLFLKSWDCEHKAIKIKNAAFATSAAPTYFEPLSLCFAGKERTLIDGGIFINSPVVSAYAEGRKLISGRPEEYKGFSKEDIFVVSLGTGESTANNGYSEARNWGVANWLLALLKYVSHSGPAAADYQMKQFLPADNYVRLQVKLDKDHDEMDDTSCDNICYLRNQAKALIDSCEFEKLHEHLKKRVDEVCK